MRVAVRAGFYAFNEPMEGAVPWLYQDVKGLVSIGVGILCDPIQLAMNLPFIRPDGAMASRAEIASEWLRIKNLPPNAKGRTAAQLGHLYARPHTTLRLSQDGLRSTLEGKMNQMWLHLEKRFPAIATWPADAHLGVLSLSWACGPAFRFPKLAAALLARDWLTAAVECFMPEEHSISGLRPRNLANRVLFENAAIVEAEGMDPEMLFYPVDLNRPPTDREAPTLKELPDVSDELGPDDETQPRLVPSRPPSSPPKDEPIVDFAIVHASPYREPPDDAA